MEYVNIDSSLACAFISEGYGDGFEQFERPASHTKLAWLHLQMKTHVVVLAIDQTFMTHNKLTFLLKPRYYLTKLLFLKSSARKLYSQYWDFLK